jgi:hypothetical protein
MPRLESILLHSASGGGYNELTPLSAIRRGPSVSHPLILAQNVIHPSQCLHGGG